MKKLPEQKYSANFNSDSNLSPTTKTNRQNPSTISTDRTTKQEIFKIALDQLSPLSPKSSTKASTARNLSPLRMKIHLKPPGKLPQKLDIQKESQSSSIRVFITPSLDRIAFEQTKSLQETLLPQAQRQGQLTSPSVHHQSLQDRDDTQKRVTPQRQSYFQQRNTNTNDVQVQTITEKTFYPSSIPLIPLSGFQSPTSSISSPSQRFSLIELKKTKQSQSVKRFRVPSKEHVLTTNLSSYNKEITNSIQSTSPLQPQKHLINQYQTGSQSSRTIYEEYIRKIKNREANNNNNNTTESTSQLNSTNQLQSQQPFIDRQQRVMPSRKQQQQISNREYFNFNASNAYNEFGSPNNASSLQAINDNASATSTADTNVKLKFPASRVELEEFSKAQSKNELRFAVLSDQDRSSMFLQQSQPRILSKNKPLNTKSMTRVISPSSIQHSLPKNYSILQQPTLEDLLNRVEGGTESRRFNQTNNINQQRKVHSQQQYSSNQLLPAVQTQSSKHNSILQQSQQQQQSQSVFQYTSLQQILSGSVVEEDHTHHSTGTMKADDLTRSIQKSSTSFSYKKDAILFKQDFLETETDEDQSNKQWLIEQTNLVNHLQQNKIWMRKRAEDYLEKNARIGRAIQRICLMDNESFVFFIMNFLQFCIEDMFFVSKQRISKVQLENPPVFQFSQKIPEDIIHPIIDDILASLDQQQQQLHEEKATSSTTIPLAAAEPTPLFGFETYKLHVKRCVVSHLLPVTKIEFLGGFARIRQLISMGVHALNKLINNSASELNLLPEEPEPKMPVSLTAATTTATNTTTTTTINPAIAMSQAHIQIKKQLIRDELNKAQINKNGLNNSLPGTILIDKHLMPLFCAIVNRDQETIAMQISIFKQAKCTMSHYDFFAIKKVVWDILVLIKLQVPLRDHIMIQIENLRGQFFQMPGSADFIVPLSSLATSLVKAYEIGNYLRQPTSIPENSLFLGLMFDVLYNRIEYEAFISANQHRLKFQLNDRFFEFFEKFLLEEMSSKLDVKRISDLKLRIAKLRIKAKVSVDIYSIVNDDPETFTNNALTFLATWVSKYSQTSSMIDGKSLEFKFLELFLKCALSRQDMYSILDTEPAIVIFALNDMTLQFWIKGIIAYFDHLNIHKQNYKHVLNYLTFLLQIEQQKSKISRLKLNHNN